MNDDVREWTYTVLRKLNRDQVHNIVKDASGCILLLYYRLQCYEMAINGKVVKAQKTGYATTSSGAKKFREEKWA